jgi:hypothetical protein
LTAIVFHLNKFKEEFIKMKNHFFLPLFPQYLLLFPILKYHPEALIVFSEMGFPALYSFYGGEKYVRNDTI